MQLHLVGHPMRLVGDPVCRTVVAVLTAWCLLLCAAPAAPQAASADPATAGPVRFNRDVRPLLSDRCFACHGPDAESRKAGLRLDRPDGEEGAYATREGRAAVVPGSLDESEIWRRLTTADKGDAMPPASSHKKPLTDAERDVIRRWILEGAGYERHWSFVVPRREAAPVVDGDRWSRDDLDRYVLRRLRARGMQPAEPADRRTLIRRWSLDLTGLPPTREEIAAFLADRAPDADARLVDSLLAKPQYGEHMARSWLDLVRFADTNGVHHDHYRDMSPYRDWVIRAFNANMPFDRFASDQIAGDLYPESTTDQKVASGFHRLHMIIDRGTALPEESLARNVIDRVTAFGTAFLGLTMGCAVCHDHKYDPIRQRDFYALSAFFNNFDGAPETGGRRGTDFRRGLQPPYVELPSDAQKKDLTQRDADLAVAREVLAFLEGARKKDGKAGEKADETKGEEAAKKAPPDPRDKALEGEIAHAEKRVRELTGKRDAVLMTIPAAMVMKERAEARPAHILVRGAYDNPGEQVDRDTPAFLPPLRATGETGSSSRLDLARWLTAPDHPLTARVFVNRVWQQLFGTGLVKTSEDFGAQGEVPSHPDLLDHLAVSFVESGWDVKALVRRIVLSATWRQSAVARPEQFAADPDNRLLARGSRFRMDAEVIRDQILATAGLLNGTMFGKSVKPPQPDGVWKAVTLPSSYPRTFQADTGEKIYRRSLYTFWKRALPPPQMTLLNAPTREFCTARRERTNTPLQALLLWNEQEYLKAARHLAHRTLQADGSDAERLEAVYEALTAHLPDAAEAVSLQRSLADLRALYADEPELAEALCEDVSLEDGITAVDLAAWTMIVHTLYNLDVTRTRQ